MGRAQVKSDNRAGYDQHAQTMLIDTDVHERYKSYKDLLPYLPEFWQRFLREFEFVPAGAMRNGAPYANPIPKRSDWDLPGGTELERLQVHLLDAQRVSIGILCGNGNQYYSAMKGHFELATALCSAYNDWQIDQWLNKDSRLRGSVHVAAHDPAAAAREIDRVAAHPQVVQVFLPAVTDRQYGDSFYRPIFEAAVRNRLVVTMHHGAFTETVLGYPRYYTEWHTVAAPQALQNQLLSMICNGLFDRYPDLKVVLLETGVAWVPWFMWRLDQQYRETRIEIPWVKRLPSEHMRDSVRISTQPMTDIKPADFVRLVEMVDSERMFVFATDFPHYDADVPDQVLGRILPDGLRRRIQYQNAIESYPRLNGLAPD